MSEQNNIVELNEIEIGTVSAGALQWSGVAWTGSGFTYYRGHAPAKWVVVIPSSDDWNDS